MEAVENQNQVFRTGYQAKSGENRANGANIAYYRKRLFLGGSNPDVLPQAVKQWARSSTVFDLPRSCRIFASHRLKPMPPPWVSERPGR